MVWYLIKKYQVLFACIFFLLISLYMMTSGVRGPGKERVFGSVVSYLVEPVHISTISVIRYIKGIWMDYIYLIGVKKENKRLRDRIDELVRANEELREKALFAERLQGYLEFKKNYPYRLSAVRIIGRDPTNLYHIALVDKGKRDGIRKDMAVITPQGIAGRIIDVFHYTSKVLLIVDANSAIDAIIQRNRIRGIVKGRGDNTLLLKYIPENEDVAIGDLILSSGTSGIFPRGFPIGSVTRVEEGKDGFFKYIELQPKVDLQKVEELFVVMKENDYTIDGLKSH